MPTKVVRLPSDQFRVPGYKTAATPFFLLKAKKNNREKIRLGVVVGRSVHKTAVKRNFWKRQAIAGLTPLIEPGNDILIIVSPGANRLTKKQFKEEIAKALAKNQLS